MAAPGPHVLAARLTVHAEARHLAAARMMRTHRHRPSSGCHHALSWQSLTFGD